MSPQSAKKAPAKKASKKPEKSEKKEPVKKAPAKTAPAKKAPAKKKASRPAMSTVEDVADVPVVTKASEKKTLGTPCIAFVAAGPGDPDLIAHRGARMLGDAGYVLADEVAVPIAEAFVAADLIEVVNPDAAGPAADRIKPAIDAAKAGTVVVRLLAGDPMMGSSLVG
ncbi:MAG: SAM-dependent methyltransferase, partial [Candidatus Nanopelagicales bacterium]|nr:SAM-dependent methyltransferase [Candidatus Nanopelagicales bacterium]